MKIFNPATEELITEVQVDNVESIARKFAAAKLAQPAWARTTWEQKLGCLTRFRALLEQDQATLARTLSLETGKPVTQALNEVRGTLQRIDFFLENTSDVLADESVFHDSETNMEEIIRHEPLGLIVNISAWNYPYFVGTNVFIPALLTGNAVLYKPSEYSSLTGLKIAERLHAAGVPTAIFTPIIGDGGVGSAILSHPVNGVFFTGSYSTGAKIAETVGKSMVKMQLELGGKDPSYVCDDVDQKMAAASLADGAFYNAGQSCCSVERIYVHEKVYDAFIQSFLSTVKGFEIGDPLAETTYIGPLTRRAQIGLLEKQIADAVAKGGKILTGGRALTDRKGNYFAPTVIVDVNHTMDLMRDESFGPLIGIQRVKNDEEALKLMNDTPYGLTAGVYTKSKSRAEKILAEVNSGSVYWNCCDRVSPRLPWSGRGNSGMGLTLSTYGIQTFTQPKAWHLKG